MLERLKSAGVRILRGITLKRVSGSSVEVKTADRIQPLGSFEFIVSAVGYQSNTQLAEEINADI